MRKLWLLAGASHCEWWDGIVRRHCLGVRRIMGGNGGGWLCDSGNASDAAERRTRCLKECPHEVPVPLAQGMVGGARPAGHTPPTPPE